MAFYKCRYNDSASKGVWEYSEFDDRETEETVEEELRERCCWSWQEGYRGFDFEKIDLPPKEWLQKKAQGARIQARELAALATRYEKLIKTM